MKSGPFIDLIADTLGVEKGTTKVVARALREAGWLTTGPRGVNAPDMEPRDAARLIIALMTGAAPSRALHNFEIFQSLSCYGSEKCAQLGALLEASNVCTLDDCVSHIIAMMVAGKNPSATMLLDASVMDFSLTINETARFAIIGLAQQRFLFVDVKASCDSQRSGQSRRGGISGLEQSNDFSNSLLLNGIQTTRSLTFSEFNLIAQELVVYHGGENVREGRGDD